MTGPRIPCVGAIVTDEAGRLLLIKRGHDPEAGRWSLPGGRVEAGESDEQAVVRELHEETGLSVTCGALVGFVEREIQGGAVLVIRDYRATVGGGALQPGDDAADARWVSPADVASLPLTSGLAEALTGWGVLPSVPPAGGFVPPAGGTVPPALIAEATKRAGLIWITVPGAARPRAAWHAWQDGAAYVLTGPGEQAVPGLDATREAAVTVPSKDTGGQLLTWTAAVTRVDPASPGWAVVIGALLAGRLNPAQEPGGESPAQRWARTGQVYRLTPE